MKKTIEPHKAAAGWEATEKGGYRQSHTVADVSLGVLETKGVANVSELMHDTVSAPDWASMDPAVLAKVARNGNAHDQRKVALNTRANTATVNYIASTSKSDVILSILLTGRRDLDPSLVDRHAQSETAVVRNSARDRPDYKPKNLLQLATRAIRGAAPYRLAA